MKRLVSTLLLLAFFCTPARSACVIFGPDWKPGEANWDEKNTDFDVLDALQKDVAVPAPRERTDRPMDVTLYELDLILSVDNGDVGGTVHIEFDALEPLDTADFDFSNAGMVVSAVRVYGNPASWDHSEEVLRCTLPAQLSTGQSARVSIDYFGTPGQELYGLSNFKGGYRRKFLVDEDGRPDLDQPILATLSEPSAARAWWPCHDTPFDAEQVRLTTTAPAGFTLVAPGIFEGQTVLPDGRWRQSWFMSQPIPAYLVSIALAQYVQYSETAQLTHPETGATQTVPVEYWTTTELLEKSQFTWANTVEMLEYFDSFIAPYPYTDQKFAHAIFNFGGAMEHPSAVSMGLSTVSLRPSVIHSGPQLEFIVAHEMFHQWYGDSLHLSRWGDIWLNEGFASYGEVLWIEHKYGQEFGKEWLIRDKKLASFAGTVVDPQPPLGLFGNTIYRKGAWVLHMLRQVLGDDDFFTTLRRYATDMRQSPVTTADFQRVAQDVQREAGGARLVDDSLDWFFEPWLTWTGRPELSVEWFAGDSAVEVIVRQAAGNAYRLPIPLRIEDSDGTITVHEILVEGERSSFSFASSAGATSVNIDPDDDWLIEKSSRRLFPANRNVLLQPFPNPFNPRVSVQFFLNRAMDARLNIYDLRGRLVKTLADGRQRGELIEIDWDGRDESGDRVASGSYFFELTADDGTREIKRATLIE
jgi:aminopeptidase N